MATEGERGLSSSSGKRESPPLAFVQNSSFRSRLELVHVQPYTHAFRSRRYADKLAQRTNNSSLQMKELMETLKREVLVEDFGVAYEGKFIGGFTR